MSRLLLALLGLAAVAHDRPPIRHPKFHEPGYNPPLRKPTKLNNRRRVRPPQFYGPNTVREPGHWHPRRLRGNLDPTRFLRKTGDAREYRGEGVPV